MPKTTRDTRRRIARSLSPAEAAILATCRNDRFIMFSAPLGDAAEWTMRGNIQTKTIEQRTALLDNLTEIVNRYRVEWGVFL